MVKKNLDAFRAKLGGAYQYYDVLLVALVGLGAGVFVLWWFFDCFEGATVEYLGWAIGGAIVFRGALSLDKRAKAMDKTAEAQLESNQQGMFNKAVEHLGNESASIRLGGIYALYQLAAAEKDEPESSKKYSRDVFRILCAHLRGTTQDKGYQEKNPKRPSEEIRSLLHLLTEDGTKDVAGEEVLDFSRAFLKGADLKKAWLQKADLREAELQGVALGFAKLQGATLRGAQFQGAHLRFAELQGADLWRAQFQGADLGGAQFQGAHLLQAQFQGAHLGEAQFQGAHLEEAQFQGAYAHEEDTEDEASQKGVERIRGRIGQDTELNSAVFSGGLTREQYEGIKEAVIPGPGLSQDEADRLIKELESHVGKPEVYTLPRNANAERLTPEMAEKIIEESGL